MTDHEMRIRLAEAMGWTEIRDIPAGGLVGVPPGGALTPIPNPREDDADAARLRAWCVGQGWIAELRCDRYMAVGTVRDDVNVILGQGLMEASEDRDPLRRERLALCRAVLQALDTIDAGGEA